MINFTYTEVRGTATSVRCSLCLGKWERREKDQGVGRQRHGGGIQDDGTGTWLKVTRGREGEGEF